MGDLVFNTLETKPFIVFFHIMCLCVDVSIYTPPPPFLDVFSDL